jgi:predicted ATP-binding protein involved in virulence
MRLNQIQVKNFRGLENYNCSFSENLSIITGDSGSRKTSLIKALAIGIGSLCLGFDDLKSMNINRKDVRFLTQRKEQSFKQQYPVTISCQGIIDNKQVSWTRELKTAKGKTTKKDAQELILIAQDIQSKLRQGEDILMPLIAYYGADRYWNLLVKKPIKPKRPVSSILGNLNWCNHRKSYQDFLSWFKIMYLIEKQNGKPWYIFSAVKSAIIKSSDFIQDINYNLSEDEVVIETINEQIYPLWMLDQGHFTFISFIYDLAYRCAVLNSQFDEEVLEKTSGIVLIDDIELHLDHNLQKHIISTLQTIFPMLQFIVTTHSPIICQSLPSSSIIKMEV